MFHKSLEEFISHQKQRLIDEKLKFKSFDLQQAAKNDTEDLVSNKRDVNSAEKENIPCNSNSEISQENDCRMLRYGEFSPNNPKMRVATQPYLGLGEYEQRKHFLLQQRKAEYQHYAEKAKLAVEAERHFLKNSLPASRPVSCSRDKAVQTDIQNVNSRLIQYDPNPRPSIEKEKSSRGHGVKIDKVQIETQNNIIIPGQAKFGDKATLAKANSPRGKLMADLQSSYLPTLMGYAAADTEDEDRLEKVRRQEKYLSELKQQIEEKQILVAKHKQQEKHEQERDARKLESELRSINLGENRSISNSYNADLQDRSDKVRRQETYLSELKQQIEEKQILVTKHKQQEKHEQEMDARRLESQLGSINLDEKHLISGSHSYNTDLQMRNRVPESKTVNKNNKWSDSKYTHAYTHTSHCDPVVSKHPYVNSPPLTRRDKRPPYSFNIPQNSIFSKSTSHKENIDKRDSKYINSTTKYPTKDSQRRSYIKTNKFDESMSIPILKAQSPVAKELKNAVAVQSKSSEAIRKLEDKWQIPAVQKNIIKAAERPMEGDNNHSILTQLGAIRLQLQQEQLRLDETLRKRGSSQIVQADIHQNFV